MKRFDHPALGRFTRDEFDGYCQRLRLVGRRVVLTLDCGFEGPERVAVHLAACLKIAERVHGSWERMVEQAARIVSTQCLKTVNRIRAFERKPAFTSEQLRRRIRLVDLSIAPGGGSIGFLANSYTDEHDRLRVWFGPRGGLRDAGWTDGNARWRDCSLRPSRSVSRWEIGASRGGDSSSGSCRPVFATGLLAAAIWSRAGSRAFRQSLTISPSDLLLVRHRGR